jgi:pimeloyl-ACP methyl ester carboxylesterase
MNVRNPYGRLQHYRTSARVPPHGLEISYLHLPGDGVPVVMLHGAGGCAVQWERQAEHLHALGHRVLVLDLRGHGLSDKSADSYWTSDFMDDLLGWMDLVSLGERFHLVGHSFGGYLSTLLAARMPERVARLVLMNTTGNVKHLGILPRTAASLPPLLLNVVHRAVPVLSSQPPHVTRLFMIQAIAEWECWDLYPQLQCPTLVTTGRWDHVAPMEHAARMAEMIPQSELQIFKFSRHMSMIEQARAVSNALETFFSANGSGAASTAPLERSLLPPEIRDLIASGRAADAALQLRAMLDSDRVVPASATFATLLTWLATQSREAAQDATLPEAKRHNFMREARQAAREAEALAPRFPALAPRAYRERALLSLQRKRPLLARRYLDLSLQAARQQGDASELAITMRLSAELF